MQSTEAPHVRPPTLRHLSFWAKPMGCVGPFAQTSCPYGLKGPIEPVTAAVTAPSIRRDDYSAAHWE
jgi:hypothetical protein